jgi:hypothetical protein
MMPVIRIRLRFITVPPVSPESYCEEFSSQWENP